MDIIRNVEYSAKTYSEVFLENSYAVCGNWEIIQKEKNAFQTFSIFSNLISKVFKLR